MQDCVTTWQDVVHEFLELFQIDLIDSDHARLQFLHETPVQVGEAEVCNVSPRVLVDGVIHCEHLAIQRDVFCELVKVEGRFVLQVLELKSLQGVC